MVKLSEQKGKGFKKSVGFELKNGLRKQKVWWLGKDRQKADILVLRIKSEWQAIKVSGGNVWTDQAIQDLMNLKASLYQLQPVQGISQPIKGNSPPTETMVPAMPQQQSPGKPLTYYQAVDYFCNNVIPKMSVTKQWKRDLKDRMQHLKDALKDLALVEISSEQLSSIVNYYKSRPNNKKYNRSISIDFAKTQIKTAKRLFEWLVDQGLWVMCRGFKKAFNIQSTDFKLTNKEKIKAIKGKPIFTVDELTELYQVANPQIKEYMILSLNCGFTQSEISRLLVGECNLDEDNPHIIKLRDKSGNVTIGKWSLWQETVNILKSNIFPKYQWDYKKDDKGVIWYKSINSDEWRIHDCQFKGAYKDLMADKLRFENRTVQETDYIYGGLVYLNENGAKIDAIASAWWRLLNKCPDVNQFSFKSLRKTGANMIKKITSEETAMVFLSHSSKTVAGKHYTDEDYDKLSAALIVMREKLQPMFNAGK